MDQNAEKSSKYVSEKLIPHESLFEYIDSYRVIEAPGPAGESSHGVMFPLGYPMIEFNLSDRWIKRSTNSDSDEIISSNITSFTGEPFRIQPLGKVRTAVARLNPVALRKFFGDDIEKNTILDPYLVFGREFSEAEEKIALAATPIEIKSHMDEFFIRAFGASRIRIDYRVSHMIAMIIAGNGAIDIGHASKKIGISQKRIEQIFKTHVGMSPKAYAGIVRFQKVLALYKPNQSLTDLAHQAGYYDQSHFIRHFKQITKTKPREFFRKECIYTCKISNLYNFSSGNGLIVAEV